MGKSEPNYKRNANNAKKADVILETDNEILGRVEKLSFEIQKTNEKLDVIARGAAGASGERASRQISEVHDSLQQQVNSLKLEMKYLAAQNESIFTALKKQMDDLAALMGGAPSQSGGYAASMRAEIDYDKLAEKVAQMLPVQEVISPDYIACKVAEQIVVPEHAVPTQYAQEEGEQNQEYRSLSAPMPVDLQLDEDELADRIALKVGGIKADDFDILVDDDGCNSISKDIVEKLNYDLISSAIAEKLRSTLEYLTERETDYDEVASRIGDKIKVAGINEDAIAEKAAAVLSEYLPELDSDDIADKVVSQLMTGLPAASVDSEQISKSVSEKLIENQESHDYDIVIDEDGIGQITDRVAGEIGKSSDERFDKIERQISELKAMMASGVILHEAAASASEAYDSGYVAEDSSLVTVSDLVDADAVGSADGSDGLSVLIAGADDSDSGKEGDLDGVDFANMMKYDRSFIARIIQSSDEIKQYYGSVKTALLSYAKVNSNVAWGAERFNKGRETIARFKIRGKTLCLYLALNPADYEYSVYHHADVSDNKSMHGTPLMVKIKSPRGAKKAIRLVDEMLENMGAVKRNKVIERDYAAMYPYETMEELIEDGLVKDVEKGK